jgi:hypothetical protein
MLFPHAQQAVGGHWFFGTLNADDLRLTENCSALSQACGGRAEHHRTRRCDRLHPLSHSDLLTNGGVRARTDFTGDYLPGVQAHPQPEVDTVAVIDLHGNPLGLILNA